MIKVVMFANGTLAIAFDVFKDNTYFGHIEYRKYNHELRFEHRSGYWFRDNDTVKAVSLALDSVAAISIEEEMLS